MYDEAFWLGRLKFLRPNIKRIVEGAGKAPFNQFSGKF